MTVVSMVPAVRSLFGSSAAPRGKESGGDRVDCSGCPVAVRPVRRAAREESGGSGMTAVLTRSLSLRKGLVSA